MTSFTRSRIAFGLLLLLAACIAAPLLAQAGSPMDLTGTWTKIRNEDAHERGSGPDPANIGACG